MVIAADLVTLSLIDGGSSVPIAALRRHELTLSRGLSDATKAAGDGWREVAVLDRPLSADLRASGVFVSGTAMGLVRAASLEAEPKVFVFDLPGDGIWQGSFYVSTLTISGQSEDEMMFSLRLTSTGAVAFTAHP
ncbi:MAG: phage tail tube protein [Pseudomonadota bacterium]